jgi:hypothetical protein
MDARSVELNRVGDWLTAPPLAGSPDRAGTLDFSRRGLAEMASDSNDLLLVLDDIQLVWHEQLWQIIGLSRGHDAAVSRTSGARSSSPARRRLT